MSTRDEAHGAASAGDAADVASADRPRLWPFLALYFCEGAPIGFLWWALPTILRQQGVDVERIAMIGALLALPWTFKFVLGPLVDCGRSAWWQLREWTLLAQGLMGAALLPLLWLDWKEQPNWFITCLLAHACCAALQDCAIDATAIHCVPVRWRGALNGRMQAGMLLGRSLFGGGVLLVADWLERTALGGSAVAVQRTLIMLLIAAIWGTALVTFTLRVPSAPAHALADFFAQLKQAATSTMTWIGLGAALLSGAAFEATGALSGPMLLDQGFVSGEIGWLYAGPVVGLTLVGGLLGGRVADRLGSGGAMISFLVACALAVLGLALTVGHASLAANLTLLALWLTMYFCVGGFTVASYAWFMNLTQPRLGATQFSLYMSATNGCEALSARSAGFLFHHGGYRLAFAIPASVSLLAAVALLLLVRKVPARTEPDCSSP